MDDYSYSNLQIRIRNYDPHQNAYPLEAELDDGSSFGNSWLRLDSEKLLMLKLDAHAYGMALFEALFADEIRTAYNIATGKASEKNEGRLRVRLRIDDAAAELHSLPWERLYHRHGGQEIPLSISELTPFSRYAGLQIAEPAPLSGRPIRMLFAAANPANLPAGMAQVRVEEEIANLQKAVSLLHHRGDLELTVVPGRTGLSAELSAALLREGHQII